LRKFYQFSGIKSVDRLSWTLQKLTLKVLPFEKCEKVHRKHTPRVICAGTITDENMCESDEGAPLTMVTYSRCLFFVDSQHNLA